jgi:radical SAM protein with 4Fe4S-binding SPASM domain
MAFPFVPKVAGWELTRRCNMQCLHCGSRAGTAHDNELTTEEGLRLCDALVDLGCEVLTLSGGEPLIHPDFHIFAERLLAGGVRTYLITNGFFIEEKIERIVSSGIRRVGISIDGCEEHHNYIRQNPESYSRALRGARLLIGKGISVGAVTHVSRVNFDDLEDMYRVFTHEGFSFWQVQITFLSGRMLDNRSLSCVPEDMPAIAEFVARARAEGKMQIAAGDNLGYYSKYNLADHPWKGCFAGRWLLGIDADGGVKGCLSLTREFVEDNIRLRPLRQIWEDPERFKFNRCFNPEDLGGYCRECDKAMQCRGGCSVTAFSATGSVHNNPYCLYRVERQKDSGTGADG